MKALVFDRSKNSWEGSKGLEKVDVPDPVLGKSDEKSVIIKVRYAGVCGSDKGLWNRTAFHDQVFANLDREKKDIHIAGHEFCGDIVQVGKKVRGLKKGDFVSAESHVVCEKCFQCKNDQKNVCANEQILGLSHDGCYAEFIKIPAHIVWKTNIKKIRAEVAAMQEPFGNSVHAASKVPLKNKTIAIYGLGPTGLFLLLAAQGLGAKKIIGIEPNPIAQVIAKKLGIDEIVEAPNQDVDVAFEMSGYNDALNSAIKHTRRGGDVILFGIKNADFTLKDYNHLVLKGITMHAVAGRHLWKTWNTTKKLFENKNNKIQDKIWNVILDKGNDTILPFVDYSKEAFEQKMQKHPKFLIKF